MSLNNNNVDNYSLHPLAADDVVKGAEIWVRFDMRTAKENLPAPSKMYLGWVTRITAADVVWIRFGRSNGTTYTFDLDEMLENKGDFMRAGPTVTAYEKDQWDVEEENCADALYMLSCIAACIEI